jgi:hypothetical protein
MPRSRFLLFSLPRCGSTTLMRILTCHPEISCLREPFNPDQSGRSYLDRVHDHRTLTATLGEIWTNHQGIKHVWHPSGWPFPDPSINLLMLDQPNITVLFLNRRNGLRRLISYEIAMQTDVWHRRDPMPNRPLAALDVTALHIDLAAARSAAAVCLSRLAAAQARFKQLWYEDLFGPGLAPAARLARVDEMLRFLGYGPLTGAGARTRVAGLLDASPNQFNDERSYRRIPNIDEIDALCGNDLVGRVFTSEP